jgi:hypothetical protein
VRPNYYSGKSQFGHSLKSCLSLTKLFTKQAQEASLLNKSRVLAAALGRTNYIKLFMACLVNYIVSSSQEISLIIVSKASAYLSEASLRCATLCKLLALPTNIRLG